MKILVSSLLLSLALFARMNPFEATDTFEEKKLKLLAQQQALNLQGVEYTDSIEIQEDKVVDTSNDIVNIITKKKEANKISESKSQCNDSYVFEPLPFLIVSINNDMFTLNVKKEYELINQDINIANQKFVFDFKSDESFYTIRQELCSDYFSSFVIGSHIKDGFFRVVIKANDKVKSYQSQIDVINNSISLKYMK